MAYTRSEPSRRPTATLSEVSRTLSTPSSDTFWADLLRARADFASRACGVVTMVRVREPLSWYRSYYEWMVVGRIRGGQGFLFGDNFTDWLPYNLQSRFLLWGDPVAAGERRVRGGIGVEGSRLPLRPNRPGAGRANRTPARRGACACAMR